MPTVRFNNRIDGGAGDFSRGVITKDDRGLARGVNDPRWGDECVVAGAVDPDDLTELLADSFYFSKILRTGIDADGATPVTVTTERSTSSSGLTLNIYYGSVRDLKLSGAPSVSGGFGVKTLANGDEWWRWEARLCGTGEGDIGDLGLTSLGVSSGGSQLGFPHNVADDFGDAIGNLRVDGDGASGGNQPYDSDGAVIFIPRSALVMWGCVMIQCTALRYSAGSVAGADAAYVPLGTGLFYWQRERDPDRTGGNWVTLRGEDDFVYTTGGVRHDQQPGRFRGEAWNLNAYTTWRRSDSRPDRFEYGSADYMTAGSAAGVGPDAAAKIAQNFWGRFRRDASTGIWTAAAALEDLIDMSAHATMASDDTGHIHGCGVIECVESANSRNAEQRIALRGDPHEVNGLSRRVYRAGAGYDPDDDAFDSHFGDISNWSAEEFIVGDGSALYGSRLISAQQGPAWGDLLLFSDDGNEDVLRFNALTEGGGITAATVYGQAQDEYAYTFRVNCDKPATPNCRMVCDPHNAGLNSDKTKHVLYSPDGGATWTPVFKKTLSNQTAGLCGDDLILCSLNGGMYAAPLPAVVRMTPILLAPGGKNCAVDNYFTSKFGGAAAVTNLTRTGGVFVDGSTDLPPDPSLMSRAMKFTMTGAGGNLVIHPGDTSAVASTGGGFTDGAKMRTFVVDVLSNLDEYPTHKGCCTNLRTRTFNGSGDASNIYAARAVGQTQIAVLDSQRWWRDGQVVPHTYGAGNTSNVQLRFLMEDSGGVPQDQRFRAILEGVYESDQHVPYPVSPNTDASGNPESVALGVGGSGWAVTDGSTIFGLFRLGRTVSGSLAWYADSTLTAIEVPISIIEVGDPAGEDWFVMEFVLGVPSGGSPTTRTLRFRGKADNTAFDEEIDIGEQSLASSGAPTEYLMLYPGDLVNFSIRVTGSGLVPIMSVNGLRVTDGSAVPNTAGLASAVMTWAQIGADFQDADARPAELEWFGARVDPASLSSEAAEHQMQRMGYLTPRGGAKRGRGRSRARSGHWLDRYA